MLKKHMKAKEIWYTAQFPLHRLPEQSENLQCTARVWSR